MSATISKPRSGAARALTVAVAAAVVSGCGSTLDRISQIGAAPPLAPIENPVEKPEYRPVSLPMPSPEEPVRHANSLWRAGARAFFKDQRASRVGDILTVNIDVKDEARINNSTSRSRNNSENADLTNFLGYEGSLAQFLPEAINPGSLVDVGSSSTSTGAGSVDREEEINLVVAALVTQILPNGNMVIFGRQEVRVNFEVRELIVTGIVRPEDITSENTVRHTQIAEARIAYGGRGQLTDVQQARYGQQLYDILMPF